MDLQTLGKLLALMGVSMVVVGGLFVLFGRIGLGWLPGDLRISGENWGCYVPIVTSILISIVLTIVLNVILRFFAK